MYSSHSGWPGDDDGGYRYSCDGNASTTLPGGQDNPAYIEDEQDENEHNNPLKSHTRGPPDGGSQHTQKLVCASCGKLCTEPPRSGSHDTLERTALTHHATLPSSGHGSLQHLARARGHVRSGSYGLFSRHSSPSRSSTRSNRSVKSDMFGIEETAFHSLGSRTAVSKPDAGFNKNSSTSVSFIQSMMSRR